MVFIPRISLKTGISPSLIRSFPTDGIFSGTQKLLLVKNRIFGNKIGGHMRSGIQVFHKYKYPKNIFDQHRIDFHSIHKFFPAFKDLGEQEYHRMMKQKKLDKVCCLVICVESQEGVQEEEMRVEGKMMNCVNLDHLFYWQGQGDIKLKKEKINSMLVKEI